MSSFLLWHVHLPGGPETSRHLCKHMPAVLIILGPKSPPQPSLLIEWDMHHQHQHHQQEIVVKGQAVKDQLLSKNHAKSAPVHGIPSVAVHAVDHQLPAQRHNHVRAWSLSSHTEQVCTAAEPPEST